MAKGPKDQAVSERLPVARVAVDISLAHLDRPFDYLVPARLDAEAVPGCRVRVRFAGQLVDGYLLERAETSEHQGRLARLERVISPEPVLTPEIFDLARAVADRYAGTLADVLRLAIPPRHATAEREAPAVGTARAPAPATRPAPPDPAPGAAIPPGRRSWPAWPRAARSGPPGRRCPVRNGPPRSPPSPPPPLHPPPQPPPPRPPRAAACSSSCRTPATWTALTRP